VPNTLSDTANTSQSRHEVTVHPSSSGKMEEEIQVFTVAPSILNIQPLD
jgi:hypothetical protein